MRQLGFDEIPSEEQQALMQYARTVSIERLHVMIAAREKIRRRGKAKLKHTDSLRILTAELNRRS